MALDAGSGRRPPHQFSAPITPTTGKIARRFTAKTMIVRHSPGAKRITLGADKAYDAAELHSTTCARWPSRRTLLSTTTAADGRPSTGPTPHDPPGYAISHKQRQRTQEPFGWGKSIGGLARPMLRGARRLAFKFTLTMAAYDLVRLPKLIGAAA